jgi:RluA family pseudouridine synthase
VRSILPRSPARPGREPHALKLTARRYRRLAEGRLAGRRADDVAREWLAEVLGTEPSRAAVRRLIMAGGLRVRGQPLRAPGRLIDGGAALELIVRPELVRRDDGPSSLDEARVLYEDEALIAVDKPPGLPTVASADPRRPFLVGLVERLLGSRARGRRPDPGDHVGVHQRLDQDTSGVVIFVKDPAANAGLAAQFAAHTVEKTYLALTVRPPRLPPKTWRSEAAVEDARGAARGSRPAVTDFVVVEVLANGLFVQAHPRTGRKHQVRVHLAEAGMPILGDRRYGGDTGVAPRVMLHAARLRLRHPLTRAPLSVESPLPADFRAVLDGLRAPRVTGPAVRPRKRGR